MGLVLKGLIIPWDLLFHDQKDHVNSPTFIKVNLLSLLQNSICKNKNNSSSENKGHCVRMVSWPQDQGKRKRKIYREKLSIITLSVSYFKSSKISTITICDHADNDNNTQPDINYNILQVLLLIYQKLLTLGIMRYFWEKSKCIVVEAQTTPDSTAIFQTTSNSSQLTS